MLPARAKPYGQRLRGTRRSGPWAKTTGAACRPAIALRGLSPEQARGRSDLDARSDIYSLGAVAYALLTGRPPFDGTNPLDVMMAHVRDEVVRPSKHQAEMPADLERVILRCLAKNPEDRFQDVESLEQDLADCAADQWTQWHATLWWHEKDPAAVMPQEISIAATA